MILDQVTNSIAQYQNKVTCHAVLARKALTHLLIMLERKVILIKTPSNNLKCTD